MRFMVRSCTSWGTSWTHTSTHIRRRAGTSETTATPTRMTPTPVPLLRPVFSSLFNSHEVNTMSVNWLNAVVSSVLILSCAPASHADTRHRFTLRTQGSSPQHKNVRDESLYDRAGPYTLELGLAAQARADIEAQVREFLWSHWRQHRLGHVPVTQYSKEGEPSTPFYFVEHDEKGIWHVAVSIR